MESSNTNKSRTPSRCREWERNRRNKFNDAISRLGDIVKEINKANNTSKDGENVQYPKVEIVEKAIVCLTSFIQEKAQLKAEILALQVKIDSGKKQKENTKDASTQVFIGIRKKRQNKKYVKVVMLEKLKERKALKEKSVLTTNAKVDAKPIKSKATTKETTSNAPTKLPILLPKSNLNDKKGPENTIVVLPAAPYIFPQRPLILPTVPPTFVFLEPNYQTLNKSSFPIVNRNNSETTKTTMVNILPISAYSRPLSASKTKKSNTKSKIETSKRVKKPKQVSISKEQTSKATADIPKTDPSINIETSNNEKPQVSESIVEKPNELKTTDSINEVRSDNSLSKSSNISKKVQAATNFDKIDNITINSKIEGKPAVTTVDVVKETITPKSSNNTVVETPVVQGPNDLTVNLVEKDKTNKVTPGKESIEKDKENKLPNILGSTICDSAVDTGNARLELAEEFLAASPTAAFLMSFPLVSGNRADSPAEETPNAMQVNVKDTNTQRRTETQTLPYFEKPSIPVEAKDKQPVSVKSQIPPNSSLSKQNSQPKFSEQANTNKQDGIKTANTIVTSTTASENPFLNLPMSSLLSTSCTLPDATFNLDFDCHINKSLPSQSSSYVSNSNFFYKSDPFSTVKSTIYSTSTISSGHEFNSFGLYPCAMEKYSTKNKTDYPNVEDNLMKIGSSRLTYDIDLGWSHKSFDFVNCTSAPNTFNKDSILTSTSGTYSTSYNPFNPDFHMPLVSNTNKKDNSSSKPNPSFSESITSFYSQPTNLWSEDVPFYNNNNNIPKTLPNRTQNYLPVDHSHATIKSNVPKQYEQKQIREGTTENILKGTNTGVAQQIPTDKYAKKSSNKMHINWMTSEVRPMQATCDPTHTGIKDNSKPSYISLDQPAKKQDHTENNSYFPISMHNFPSQAVQEELQVWPSVRPAGPTEISIEPPPINLPTLVGDLALGPHEKKKSDMLNRSGPQNDLQNCTNYFSVTHLMNRSSENTVPSRYQTNNIDAQKPISTKQNITHTVNDNRKTIPRIESHVPQPCYGFTDTKSINSYENMPQFPQSKVKSNKADKQSTKVQKNSYSAESLIRGGTCNPKLHDNNSAKFMIPSQKYNDFSTPQDNSVAQVSHFPPILDYSDNTYTGQQFSGTNLYNSTTNTISNSFYSNFMPGSSNLMSGNYGGGPFAGDFIDYNQTAECNYSNPKYTELKMRNNPSMFNQEKISSNYKSSRRESAAKHKLECSKKDASKKCQSKRAKLNNEVEEWNDAAHLLWQNKTPTKRPGNLMTEELPFPNYVGNQMAGQYQPDFFNSHIMSTNVQGVGHNVDRSLASFPVTSRANFNLSTIFPEITMKVQ